MPLAQAGSNRVVDPSRWVIRCTGPTSDTHAEDRPDQTLNRTCSRSGVSGDNSFTSPAHTADTLTAERLSAALRGDRPGCSKAPDCCQPVIPSRGRRLVECQRVVYEASVATVISSAVS